MSLTTIALVLGCLTYTGLALSKGKFNQNNPAMRKHYGLRESDRIDFVWPNGCLWMRHISGAEKATVAVGSLIMLPFGGCLESGYDRFVLCKLANGDFVINDQSESGNRGQIRFRKEQIQSFKVIKVNHDKAACGFLKFEPCDALEFQLDGQGIFWVSLPRSATEALRG